MRVAMFVFNPCTHDARVDREASTLAAAGHQVRVYAFLEPGLPQRERRGGYTILRVDQRTPLQRFVDDRLLRPLKGRRKRSPAPVPPPEVDRERPPAPLGPPPPRDLPAESTPAERSHREYISRINRVWARLAACWRPHVCHAHDLNTLEGAREAACLAGARLVYDAHELWSEQPFIDNREAVAYWDALEAQLIGACDAVITVNEPLAEEFKRRYGVGRVLPLLNCSRMETPDPARRRCLRSRSGGRPVALYQGGLQPARGLEQLVAAASLQNRVVVALRGYGTHRPALEALAREQEAPVIFLEPLPCERMVEGAAEADIGVIPYVPTGLNNYLSTPNKLFEYMMAGLPIAGADLPELRRYLEGEGIGALFDPYSPRDIARALVELACPERLEELSARSRAAAERRYHWETEAERLLDLYRSLEPFTENSPSSHNRRSSSHTAPLGC